MENKSQNSRTKQPAAFHLKAFILLLGICSLSFAKLSAQQLPTDTELLKMMYGSCDPNGKTYTRPHTQGEPSDEKYPNVSYSIAFKQICKVDGQNVLFIISQAPIAYQSYHTFRLTDYFFFISYDNTWLFYNTTKGDFSKALIDADKFQLVEIGNDRNALLTTFEISDIANDSRAISLELIHLTGLATVFTTDLDYTCHISKGSQASTPQDTCETKNFSSTYKIMKTDKPWHDISIHKITYADAKEGTEGKVLSEVDMVYTYNGKEYVLPKK